MQQEWIHYITCSYLWGFCMCKGYLACSACSCWEVWGIPPGKVEIMRMNLEALKCNTSTPSYMHYDLHYDLATQLLYSCQLAIKIIKLYLKFNSSLKFFNTILYKVQMYLPWRKYSQLALFSLQWFEHFNSRVHVTGSLAQPDRFSRLLFYYFNFICPWKHIKLKIKQEA